MVLGVVGVLSRSRSSPPPEPLSRPPLVGLADSASVTVAIHASDHVEAAVSVDGAPTDRFVMRPNETRSFRGSVSVDVVLNHGGAADLVVNGVALRSPGTGAAPFSAVFGPQSLRSTRFGAGR
jgi:hypothetical protein